MIDPRRRIDDALEQFQSDISEPIARLYVQFGSVFGELKAAYERGEITKSELDAVMERPNEVTLLLARVFGWCKPKSRQEGA